MPLMTRQTTMEPDPGPYIEFRGRIVELVVKRPPLLARLFGQRKTSSDGGVTLSFIYWRGTIYCVSEKETKP